MEPRLKQQSIAANRYQATLLLERVPVTLGPSVHRTPAADGGTKVIRWPKADRCPSSMFVNPTDPTVEIDDVLQVYRSASIPTFMQSSLP